MKKYLLLISALTIFIKGANAISVTGNASVVIQTAITATQTQPMNFGTVTPTTSAGTVVLSTAGAATSGTLGLYDTTAQGIFNITAADSTALTITFTNGTVTSGANSMTVNTFTTNPATYTTNSSGALTVDVGATLNVTASQPAGSYTGTYTMTVSY
ncbi:MAG: DUF4402 domain-containing protein [Alphaproteobacteria bacterium]|nr:DUF4402 domain-containing protein [Alphaproteobacteria bacterium]